MIRHRAVCLFGSIGLVLGLLVALPARSATEPALAAGGPEASDPSTSDPPTQRDWWYRVEISGQAAGWLHLRETLADDELSSESQLVLELKRGNEQQRLEMAKRFVESTSGTPLTAWSKQVLGAQPIETHYTYTDAGVEVETRQGSATKTQRLPNPEGAWLTPGQAQKLLEEQLSADLKVIELRTVDPQLGIHPLDVRWQRLPATDAPEAEDPQISHWRQTQSLAPQMATLLDLDAEGRMVRSSVQLMGQTLSMVRVSEWQAKAEHVAPEILSQSFLFPDRTIERPRWTRRGVFDLFLADGEEMLAKSPLPTSGFQRSEVHGDRVRIVVDLEGLAGEGPANEGPANEGLANEGLANKGLDGDGSPPTVAPFLNPSTYLNYEDPQVHKLLDDALGGSSGTAARRAERLRLFVAGYLSTKNLASILATASEVAAQRSGDCTEHAVLLAALLRGDGIPSRVAAGLVYVDHFVGQEDFFGYHMWTQALIGGRWVDLDATLGSTPFDATHILLATSALDDDKTALIELARVAPWIGQTRIEVVEIGYGGGT